MDGHCGIGTVQYIYTILQYVGNIYIYQPGKIWIVVVEYISGAQPGGREILLGGRQ